MFELILSVGGLLLLLTLIVVYGCCRMRTVCEEQECREMMELLRERNIREGDPVE